MDNWVAFIIGFILGSILVGAIALHSPFSENQAAYFCGKSNCIIKELHLGCNEVAPLGANGKRYYPYTAYACQNFNASR